jgi:hypothetical protein
VLPPEVLILVGLENLDRPNPKAVSLAFLTGKLEAD